MIPLTFLNRPKSFIFGCFAATSLAAIVGGCAAAPDTSAVEDESVATDESALLVRGSGRNGIIDLSKPAELPFGLGFAMFTEEAPMVYSTERINSQCTVTLNLRPSSGTPKSAGNIRIFRQDGSLISTLAPEPLGTYSPAPIMPPALWNDGERLSIEVDGTPDVPAFRAHTFGVAPIALTSPAVGGDGTFGLSRDADLEVTWTGGGQNGVVHVSIMDAPPPSPVPADPGSRHSAVECDFKPTDHKGTIPAAALGFLRKGVGFAQVEASDRRILRRRDWKFLVGTSASSTVVPATIQ